MANESLGKAKTRKNDEFYTVFDYIQKEMNAYLEYNPDVFRGKTVLLPCDDPEWSNFTKYFAQNFETLGLKKLISTGYAADCKEQQYEQYHQMTLFELQSPQYDAQKSRAHGRIFTLERDANKSGIIDIDDLEWHYLDGDGDFRSDEVKSLRDEADIIVTNPPFSLFKDFIAWVMEAGKQLIVIGSQNAITYREIFPLLKENKLWIGFKCGDMAFTVPETYEARETRFWVDESGQKWRSFGNICWYTNLDHSKRHEDLILYKSYSEEEYPSYDNYNAIEVSKVSEIPCDYYGIMGVPITFLDKYNPEQFEIIGLDRYTVPKEFLVGGRVAINGKPRYARILIRKKEK